MAIYVIVNILVKIIDITYTVNYNFHYDIMAIINCKIRSQEISFDGG